MLLWLIIKIWSLLLTNSLGFLFYLLQWPSPPVFAFWMAILSLSSRVALLTNLIFISMSFSAVQGTVLSENFGNLWASRPSICFRCCHSGLYWLANWQPENSLIVWLWFSNPSAESFWPSEMVYFGIRTYWRILQSSEFRTFWNLLSIFC